MAPIPQEDVLQKIQEFVAQLQTEGLLAGAQVQRELFRQKITSWPPAEPSGPVSPGEPQPLTIPAITLGPIGVTDNRVKSLHVFPLGQSVTVDVLFSIDDGATLSLRQGAVGQAVSAGRIFSLTLETVVTHIGVRLTSGSTPPSSVLVVVLGG